MTTINDTSTALTSLSAAFGDTTGQEAIKPILKEHPTLQWLNGLSTTTMEMAVGWHIEADVNPQLDEAAARLGLKRYIVQHKTAEQNGETKQRPYWALSFGQRAVSLFVVSYGMQSKYQMGRTEDRLGIAYGWEVVRDAQGQIEYKKDSDEPKKQCKLQFRAFVHELYGAGFLEWLPVAISGYLTDCMLDALNEQFRTLDAYGSHTEAESGTRRDAPFFGFSLPLVPGPVKMVGPQNGEKSPIYPMVAQVPQQVDKPFLTDHMVPRDLLKLIQTELLDETVQWSIERSREINLGKASSEDHQDVQPEVVTGTVIVEETGGRGRPGAPQLVSGGDRPVNQEELKWITNGYCMGTQAYVQTVCQRFGVAAPEQLRLSHYTTLYNEATTPQPAQ